ncbi:MAG: Peroxide-responsive repressor PerR [Candidatus Heimdallarchaeota archaeon LC_3]|nr:MAG: Peroxide-responsive repressor PerR [Candidatus Heimdallarchaeota archaeon LC_3]
MEDKIKTIIQRLKKSQKKITPQREKVIEFLFTSNTENNINFLSHPTAEEIHTKLQNIEEGISISTVYNTLELLKDQNLIEEFATPMINERGKSSAIRIETNLKPHFNLICSKCHKIEDLMLSNELKFLQITILSERQFSVNKYEFYGTCSICKNSES